MESRSRHNLKALRTSHIDCVDCSSAYIQARLLLVHQTDPEHTRTRLESVNNDSSLINLENSLQLTNRSLSLSLSIDDSFKFVEKRESKH